MSDTCMHIVVYEVYTVMHVCMHIYVCINILTEKIRPKHALANTTLSWGADCAVHLWCQWIRLAKMINLAETDKRIGKERRARGKDFPNMLGKEEREQMRNLLLIYFRQIQHNNDTVRGGHEKTLIAIF